MKVLQHIIRGCGSLPQYGSHPGTGMLVIFIVMGAIAGFSRGPIYALLGMAAMALTFGPLYLYGAYERSKEYELFYENKNVSKY